MNNGEAQDPETIQLLYNELIKLDRVIESKSNELSGLIKAKSRTTSNYTAKKQKPKRYSVEFDFVPGQLIPQVRTFVVDRKTIFRPHYIDSAVRTTMFLVPGDTPESLVTITTQFGDPAAGVTRNALFSYLLGIKDSGSDREWQDHPFPDSFLLSGLVAPFYMGERAVLSQGTEVFFDINPQFSAVTPSAVFGNVILHTVSISMTGFEEML